MLSFSVILMSVVAYGFELPLILATFIVMMILAWFSNMAVDLFYYYLRQRIDFKRLTEEEHPNGKK